MSSESVTPLDWELNPEKYVTDDNGEFILKKDGTPRRKAGRAKGSKGRGYNYHTKTKKRIQAQRAVRERQKRVAAVEAKLQGQRKSLNNSKEILNKLDNKTNKTGQVVTEDVLNDAPVAIQREASDSVVFKPNDGPQTDFLAAPEIDVLYGGAAGGG